MARKLELSGQRFGRLVAVEPFGLDSIGSVVWKCKCDCGKDAFVRATLLTHKLIKSCGCYRTEWSRDIHKKKYGESAQHSLISFYRKQAKERDLCFDLLEEEFFILTRGNCHYCGVEPTQITKGRGGNGNYVYNGVDRMDNSKGYTIDNCVPCCGACNRAKRMMTKEEFMSWIDRVYHHCVEQEMIREGLSSYGH